MSDASATAMSAHDVLAEVAELGWFTSEQKKLYGVEMGLALMGDAAGYPLVTGPFEVFDEACEMAGLRRNVKAYYRLRFARALKRHVEQLARDLQAASS